MTKGHGVLSVYEELLKMLGKYYPDKYEVRINTLKKADVFHYHTVNPGFFLSLPVVRLQKAVTVGFVHFMPKTLDDSLHLPRIAKKVFYAYVIAFYRAMDRIVVVNPHFAADLIEAGIDEKKITFIPNCVSEDAFFPYDGEKKREVRRALGFSPDRRVVLGAGQLQNRKGVLDFAEIAKRHPECDFVWAGGFSFGKMSDGYEEIKALTENPPENLRFEGIVDRARMNDYYNAADLLLFPSYQELFPMTLLEAFCCRLPVVARALPEFDGVVSDYCALCADSGELEKKTAELTADPEKLAAAAALAEKGAERYCAKNVAAIWDGFYSGTNVTGT